MSNTDTDFLRKLKSILAAHEAMMLEQNGRPDCKNCALSETIQELIDDKEAEL